MSRHGDAIPPRRRFTGSLPAPERPSVRRRVLGGALFVLAVLALARLAWWVLRVPSEPVRTEHVVPLR